MIKNIDKNNGYFLIYLYKLYINITNYIYIKFRYFEFIFILSKLKKDFYYFLIIIYYFKKFY